MTPQSPNSISVNDSSRCRHRFGNGTRCRLPVSGSASFYCERHAKLSSHRREEDQLVANLTSGLTEFNSAAPVNTFLSRLLLLLAQDRISPRRAAILTYVAGQILRSLDAMDREAVTQSKRRVAPVVVWDMPGPAHERANTTNAPHETGQVSP